MEAASRNPAPPPAAPWSRRMQLALAFLLGIFAVVLVERTWQPFSPRYPLDPVSSGDAQTPLSSTVRLIDLNTASQAELELVPGIGPKRAERIIQHRTRVGPFHDVKDLDHVSGIGPRTLELISPHVYVSHSTVHAREKTDPTGQRSSPARSASTGKKSLPAQPIDLNRATREELMQLPGIGPVLADRIVADRESNGPFHRIAEITRVPGIKEKRLAAISPYVYVGSDPLEVAEANNRR